MARRQEEGPDPPRKSLRCALFSLPPPAGGHRTVPLQCGLPRTGHRSVAEPCDWCFPPGAPVARPPGGLPRSQTHGMGPPSGLVLVPYPRGGGAVPSSLSLLSLPASCCSSFHLLFIFWFQCRWITSHGVFCPPPPPPPLPSFLHFRLADQGRQLHPRFPHPRTPSLLLSVAGTPRAPKKPKLLTLDGSPLPVKRLNFGAQASPPQKMLHCTLHSGAPQPRRGHVH